jgi:hypothetical protein
MKLNAVVLREPIPPSRSPLFVDEDMNMRHVGDVFATLIADGPGSYIESEQICIAGLGETVDISVSSEVSYRLGNSSRNQSTSPINNGDCFQYRIYIADETDIGEYILGSISIGDTQIAVSATYTDYNPVNRSDSIGMFGEDITSNGYTPLGIFARDHIIYTPYRGRSSYDQLSFRLLAHNLYNPGYSSLPLAPYYIAGNPDNYLLEYTPVSSYDSNEDIWYMSFIDWLGQTSLLRYDFTSYSYNIDSFAGINTSQRVVDMHTTDSGTYWLVINQDASTSPSLISIADLSNDTTICTSDQAYTLAMQYAMQDRAQDAIRLSDVSSDTLYVVFADFIPEANYNLKILGCDTSLENPRLELVASINNISNSVDDIGTLDIVGHPNGKIYYSITDGRQDCSTCGIRVGYIDTQFYTSHSLSGNDGSMYIAHGNPESKSTLSLYKDDILLIYRSQMGNIYHKIYSDGIWLDIRRPFPANDAQNESYMRFGNEYIKSQEDFVTPRQDQSIFAQYTFSPTYGYASVVELYPTSHIDSSQYWAWCLQELFNLDISLQECTNLWNVYIWWWWASLNRGNTSPWFTSLPVCGMWWFAGIECDEDGHIVSLRLTGMNISFIPDQIAQLSHLQELDMSYNTINDIPDALTTLSRLQVLRLNNNQITSIPQSFVNLDELGSVYLQHNQLTSIPGFIFALPILDNLHIWHNSVLNISAISNPVASLSYLNLSNNRLQSLPSNLWDILSGNSIVDIRNNEFIDIPVWIINRNIQIIELSYNCLRSVSGELLEWINQYSLDWSIETQYNCPAGYGPNDQNNSWSGNDNWRGNEWGDWRGDEWGDWRGDEWGDWRGDEWGDWRGDWENNTGFDVDPDEWEEVQNDTWRTNNTWFDVDPDEWEEVQNDTWRTNNTWFDVDPDEWERISNRGWGWSRGSTPVWNQEISQISQSSRDTLSSSYSLSGNYTISRNSDILISSGIQEILPQDMYFISWRSLSISSGVSLASILLTPSTNNLDAKKIILNSIISANDTWSSDTWNIVPSTRDIIDIITSTTGITINREQAQAYVFAKNVGITSKETYEDARPYDFITRAEFAKVIVSFAENVLNKTVDSSRIPACIWYEDITDQQDLQLYIIKACSLGLMWLENDGITRLELFRPNEFMNRAQVATTLSRMLYGNLYDNSDTTYYAGHIQALQDNWLISLADPTLTEQRINIFTILMRLIQQL